MNKEKILKKIGGLIDKANLSEEDLATLWTDDETAKPVTETEQPKEDTAKAEQPKDEESGKEDGETAPVDEAPKDEAKDEPKPSSEAVADDKPEGKEPIVETPKSNDNDEIKKLIEGYKAEIDSLREALTKAGVLEQVSVKDTKQVGVGTSTSTPNLKRETETLDDVFAQMNKGRR